MTDFTATPIAIDIETDVNIKKLFDALDKVQHKDDDINLLQTESCDDLSEDLSRLKKSPVKVKSVKVGTEVQTRDQSAQAYTLPGNMRVAERQAARSTSRERLLNQPFEEHESEVHWKDYKKSLTAIGKFADKIDQLVTEIGMGKEVTRICLEPRPG